MDAGVERVLLRDPGHESAVAGAPFVEDRPGVHRLAVAAREIVEDHDVLASGDELLRERAADVACAPGDEDGHQAAAPGSAPLARSRFSRNQR